MGRLTSRSTLQFLVALALLMAVAACGPAKSRLPVPPIPAAYFLGTSQDDVWALSFDGKLAHWGGAGWSVVAGGTQVSPRGSQVSLPPNPTADGSRPDDRVLGPGRLLVFDEQGLFALDVNGAVAEDFGLPTALAGASYSWTHIVTNGKAHFASARVNANPPTHHLFRYHDGSWSDLAAPREVTKLAVSADGRVIAQTPPESTGLVYLLHSGGTWKEIQHGPDSLPRFFGDTPASTIGIAQHGQVLEVTVERLDGETWATTAVPAGSYGSDEIFLSFEPSILRGTAAVRYALRRISGSDRFIEYGYLKLREDFTFEKRLPMVKSDNVCSTACLANYEDRTTNLWTLGDGSSVFMISAKPGATPAESEYYLVDAP